MPSRIRHHEAVALRGKAAEAVLPTPEQSKDAQGPGEAVDDGRSKAHQKSEEREPPVLATPRNSFEVGIVFERERDRLAKPHTRVRRLESRCYVRFWRLSHDLSLELVSKAYCAAK